MGGISIWQLLIVAVIVVLLFGTKKLRNIGGDLGSAVKGFKNAMNDDESKDKEPSEPEQIAQNKEQSQDLKDSSKSKDQQG